MPSFKSVVVISLVIGALINTLAAIPRPFPDEEAVSVVDSTWEIPQPRSIKPALKKDDPIIAPIPQIVAKAERDPIEEDDPTILLPPVPLDPPIIISPDDKNVSSDAPIPPQKPEQGKKKPRKPPITIAGIEEFQRLLNRLWMLLSPIAGGQGDPSRREVLQEGLWDDSDMQVTDSQSVPKRTFISFVRNASKDMCGIDISTREVMCREANQKSYIALNAPRDSRQVTLSDSRQLCTVDGRNVIACTPNYKQSSVAPVENSVSPTRDLKFEGRKVCGKTRQGDRYCMDVASGGMKWYRG
jgi:hypothetical protein